MASANSSEPNSAQVICLSNHKGGVAKTCSSLNIGAGLARLGHRCLLIDLDPQANLSLSYGVRSPEQTIYGALTGAHDLRTAITPVKDNLDLVPSKLDLSGVEIELSAEVGREMVLRGLIDEVRHEYQYIVLDCPPSLGLLTVNALTAVNHVLIPLQAQYYSLQGITKLIQVIEKVAKHLNQDLSLGGVIITQYDGRKILNRNVAEGIEERFKGIVFKTRIRDNVALAESPAVSQDIFTYDAKCYGAVDYLALCKEIAARFPSPALATQDQSQPTAVPAT